MLNAAKEGRALLDDGPELVPKVDREESVFSWGRCGSRDKERTGEEVEEVRGVHHPLPRKCCQLDRIGRIPSRPVQFLEVSRDVLRDSNQESSGVNGPVVVNLLDPTLRKFPSEHVVRAGELGVGEGDLGALTLGSEVLQRVEIQHPLECLVRLQSGRRRSSAYLSRRSRGERR